jgi:hypothetical protein
MKSPTVNKTEAVTQFPSDITFAAHYDPYDINDPQVGTEDDLHNTLTMNSHQKQDSSNTFEEVLQLQNLVHGSDPIVRDFPSLSNKLFKTSTPKRFTFPLVPCTSLASDNQVLAKRANSFPNLASPNQFSPFDMSNLVRCSTLPKPPKACILSKPYINVPIQVVHKKLAQKRKKTHATGKKKKNAAFFSVYVNSDMLKKQNSWK